MIFNLFWALFLIAAALALALLWQRKINIPRLVYTPLPPYDVPEVILVGGLVVENRGRAAAPNVKIEVHYDRLDSAKIQHMHVESDEPYILRGGGEQFNFATIRLRALPPGKKLFVYWTAGQQFQPRIRVTSFKPAPHLFFARRGELRQNLIRRLSQRLR